MAIYKNLHLPGVINEVVSSGVLTRFVWIITTIKSKYGLERAPLSSANGGFKLKFGGGVFEYSGTSARLRHI